MLIRKRSVMDASGWEVVRSRSGPRPASSADRRAPPADCCPSPSGPPVAPVSVLYRKATHSEAALSPWYVTPANSQGSGTSLATARKASASCSSDHMPSASRECPNTVKPLAPSSGWRVGAGRRAQVFERGDLASAAPILDAVTVASFGSAGRS